MASEAKTLHALWAGGIDLLYPPSCALCRLRLHPYEQTLCDPCRKGLLSTVTWRCPLCGATGAADPPTRGRPCRFCPPPGACYQGVLAATHYNPFAARSVHLFKYERRMELGAMIADVMVARLAEPLLALEDRIGWVVPVPLHWGRRLWRSFNQSVVLGERLAQAIELPMMTGVLRRIRHTKMQVRIPRARRAKNVKDAFRVAPEHHDGLPGVLLVDDVVTSGSTIAECARVLTLAGAPQVWVASFVRAWETAGGQTE